MKQGTACESGHADIVYEVTQAHASDRLVAVLIITLDRNGKRQLSWVGREQDLQRCNDDVSRMTFHNGERLMA